MTPERDEIVSAQTAFRESLAGFIHASLSEGDLRDSVTCQPNIMLPGFYRPARQWAVGVRANGVLVATI
jgi:hypothetical protein